MSCCIQRLAIRIAHAFFLTALLCPCGVTFAQVTQASAGSDASGYFSGPSVVGGSSWQLGLEIVHSVKGNTSPALFYGISRPTVEKARFTYLCLVTHRFPGDAAEVAGNFQCRLHVLDGVGKLELAGGADKSSFNIVYSINVKRGARAEESLTISKLPIKLAAGRVFLVDISGETPSVDQVDFPLPDLSEDRDGYDGEVRKALDDLKESIAAGHTKKLRLELRPPDDESPN